jgi:hypothetical protein
VSVLNFVGQIFKPAADLIDNLHTSEEEKLKQKAVLLNLQTQFLTEALEQEKAALEARSSIIEAEAKGDGMLQRNWRPATMLIFVGLTVAYWFGYTPEGLSEERLQDVFELIKLGLGGYVIGRSAEKIVPGAIKAFKQKEQS